MGDITLDRQMLGEAKESYWVSYIKSRIKKNKNFLGFISGQTGSGKSWSSISICEEIDNDFDINRVVFSGLELMNLINSGTLKRGSAICFEEVGVEMNNKSWASITNKMLNYLIQTFRHRGFILIMNSPYMDFVDGSMRKLFHAEMETMGINFETKRCKLRPRLIQYNARLKKFYYKMLRVITKKGVLPIDMWKVGKPSPDMIKKYEKKKREYTDNLNKEIYIALERERLKKMDLKGREMTAVQKEVLESLNQGKNVTQIADERGVSERTIHGTIVAIKNRGIRITPVKKGTKVVYYDVKEADYRKFMRKR